MKKSRAFTLIELLVVVAIVGLLASIVVVSFETLRDRGKDGFIMEQLFPVRTKAQMILTEEGTYGPLCDIGNTLNNVDYPDLAEIEQAIKEQNGNQDVKCFATADAFCVQSPLNLTDGFCVDSTGQATTSKPVCDTDAVCKVSP